MTDGKNTTQVPDEQERLLQHSETIEQILARGNHTVAELADAITDMLEHYDIIKATVAKTALHTLIREKVDNALTHGDIQYLRPEQKTRLEDNYG